MKRPQGFDQPEAKVPTPHKNAAEPKIPLPRVGKAREPATATKKPTIERRIVKPRSPRASGTSRSRLRASTRERRRFERREVRRFTRRSRQRRLTWVVVVSIVSVTAALLAVAVYSPLLALRTVTIDGNSKVSVEDIHGAIDEQLGTPLALLDYDALKTKLDSFPLIRSFSTEVVPPSTLKIHIVERAPLGVMSSDSGFQIVDPAGVVLESVLRRPDGIPLIELGGKGTDSVAFSSVVDVMLALPESIRSRVDTVQATSKDDVRFVLVDAGQRVKWGSSERSALKARVLEELMAMQAPNARVEFDVSAPLSPVVRAG